MVPLRAFSICFCQVVPPLLRVDVTVSHHAKSSLSLQGVLLQGGLRASTRVQRKKVTDVSRHFPVEIEIILVVAGFGHYYSRFSPAVSSLVVSTILPSFLYLSHFSRHAWTSSYSRRRRSSRRSFCPVDDHQFIFGFLVGYVFIRFEPVAMCSPPRRFCA